MTTGTKSLLFGAHCFFLHPFFIAAAWWRLYGFKIVHCPSSHVTTCLLDPRLWLCFLVHDWGYWGCERMDDEKGEYHPAVGAGLVAGWVGFPLGRNEFWRDFVYYHSRFLAKKDGRRPSLLCAADKLAIALEPWWLYLPRVILSGEVKEYMQLADKGKYETMQISTVGYREWHKGMTDYCRRWAFEHRDGKVDTWTPTNT